MNVNECMLLTYSCSSNAHNDDDGDDDHDDDDDDYAAPRMNCYGILDTNSNW